MPWDELLSEAHVGLLEAAGRFDEGKGVPLGAYVTVVVRRRLKRVAQRWRRRRDRQVCFTELEGPDRAASTPDLDPADPRMPEPDCAAAIREALERVRRVLPERWFALLRLHCTRPADHVLDTADTLRGSPKLLEVSRCPNSLFRPAVPSAPAPPPVNSGSTASPASPPPV